MCFCFLVTVLFIAINLLLSPKIRKIRRVEGILFRKFNIFYLCILSTVHRPKIRLCLAHYSRKEGEGSKWHLLFIRRFNYFCECIFLSTIHRPEIGLCLAHYQVGFWHLCDKLYYIYLAYSRRNVVWNGECWIFSLVSIG